MIIVNLTNQNLLLSQMSNSLEPAGFKDGDTFSMEANDGVYDEGQTIFDLDEFDKDLIEEVENAEEAV